MLKNEKGQALITVLLVALIFSVLGLAILAASINSNQRTQFRNDDIELTAEATRKMNETIAAFTKVARSISLSEQDLLSGALDDKFVSLKNKLSTDNLEIVDLTEEFIQEKEKRTFFTRVFNFTYTLENVDGVKFAKKVSRNIYLAPTPSFLNYALGSGPEGIVELNGAADIKGDLFSGDLTTQDIAYYTDEYTIRNNLVHSEASTLLPRISFGNVFLKGQLNGLTTFPTTIEELNNYFDEESEMTLTKDTSEFIDVNIGNTVAQILNTLSTGFSEEMFQTESGINQAIYQLLSPCKSTILRGLNTSVPINTSCPNSIFLIEEQPEFSPEDIIDTNLPLTYVYTGLEKNSAGNDFQIKDPIHETHSSLDLNSDFILHDDSWLIVKGDLGILPNNNTIRLRGNIIVTGDLTIQGNQIDDTEEDDEVLVDSTIYVLGETKVSNTNITGFNDKQLVLISQGNLEITRINEFKEITDSIKPLDAFFYTHQNAELYGVGSLFSINGGLFAMNKLTINAIRQDEIRKNNNLYESIQTVSQQRGQQSRFQVMQDLDVLTDQLDSLPKVDKYQILLDEPKIENVP